MSARDVIANILRETDVGQDIEWDYFPQADDFLSALAASGYRILGPGEIDPVTVEKCAAEVEAKANSYADPKEVSLWECAKPISVRLYGAAAAIRALCATHQRDK